MSHPRLTDLKYSEILEGNLRLSKDMEGSVYNIRILSNITVSQLNEILEYALRVQNIRAVVSLGDYDNIVQDSLKYKDSDCLVIFMELCNIINGLQYEIGLLNQDSIEAVFNKVTSEIDLIFDNTKETSIVFFNRFSSVVFSGRQGSGNPLECLAARLNKYLEDKKPRNVQLINVEKVITRVGIKPSVDMRYFYSSRLLYTVTFLKEYVQYVAPYIYALNGKSRKAIIFDCDGTLWKGILGEDEKDGIDMAVDSKTGAIFAEVQSIALSWNKQGVLLGLCSKNNADEVDDIIKSHPDMRIKEEHIVIKRVNWQDKVTNLKEIAEELNIGLDSLVFVEDSPFEAELVRQQLPQVEVLQVPKDLWEYPALLRDSAGLFYGVFGTKEDQLKTKMYKDQQQREGEQKNFASMEEYLASLELKIGIKVDDATNITRLAQLTQKTNQFNLTTHRYTETEIKGFIEREDAAVISFAVSDKFGDSGLVGLCIVFISQDSKAEIDTFLMSCRVIGRNIEFSVMDYVLDYLKIHKVKQVKAKYAKTAKNAQVMDFYERCSFVLDKAEEKERFYSLKVDEYLPKKSDYLEIINGR